MLACWTVSHILAQGIVNRGVGIWINGNTSLRINGGYINQQTDTYIGVISNNGTLSVREHWTNDASSGSVFQEDSKGSVVLNGANQTVSGNTQFYDVSKQVSASATLTFQAGSTTTVKNSITLEGASGQLLLLRSSITGQPWTIILPQNKTLRYLDIKDSINSTGSAITLDNSCINSNGNTNWLFTPTIATWPSSASDIIHGQALAESTLTGGSAVNGPNAVGGNFAFVNADQRPAVGTVTHPIKFVPSDPIYVEVTGGNIDVTVKNQTNPTALNSSAVSTTEFTANWELTTVAVNYSLDVSEVSDFSSFLEGYNNRTVNSTSQIVSGISPSSHYYYRVRAVNSVGSSSENSNTITTSTLDTKILQVPDGSYPTLAAALQATNNLDTIQLAAGTYNEYGLTIERNISIIGNSAKTTVLDAEENGRLFNIPSGKTVSIKNLSIQNGREIDGGGILNYGSLTIENSQILSCTASQDGGAIKNLGELTLTGTTLSTCTAIADGGSIHNSDTASVTIEIVLSPVWKTML